MDYSSGRFAKLTIRGFRRLLDVSLELHPLTVLIGANGCGKSSVLDVLSVLANSAQGRLGPTISEMSGLPAILTYDRREELAIGIDMEVAGWEPTQYALRLRPRGVGYSFTEGLLYKDGKSLRLVSTTESGATYFDPEKRQEFSPNWALNPGETGLSQVPKMFGYAEAFRNRMASSAYYHSLSVGPRAAVRLPQPLSPAQRPGKDGEDLVSCLFSLRETHRERFELIEATIRTAYPRFERLEFPPVAAGTLGLAWREKGFSKPLYAHQLSEGTLRYLWLTALLQSPGLPALTLIDEPEVSLHPELLSLLVDQMRDASNRTQLVVATHSESLIRFLAPKEIVVCDSDEHGMTTLTRADQLNLDDWLKDYSLDELWRNGRLGARA